MTEKNEDNDRGETKFENIFTLMTEKKRRQ